MFRESVLRRPTPRFRESLKREGFVGILVDGRLGAYAVSARVWTPISIQEPGAVVTVTRGGKPDFHLVPAWIWDVCMAMLENFTAEGFRRARAMLSLPRHGGFAGLAQCDAGRNNLPERSAGQGIGAGMKKPGVFVKWGPRPELAREQMRQLRRLSSFKAVSAHRPERKAGQKGAAASVAPLDSRGGRKTRARPDWREILTRDRPPASPGSFAACFKPE